MKLPGPINICLCFSLLFPQRAIGVLSRVLPASPSAVEEVLRGGLVKKMLKFLKVNPAFFISVCTVPLSKNSPCVCPPFLSL